MAFTETETAEHLQVLDDLFWSHRRPPVHLRDQIREGQRITGRSIELFYTRPAYKRPGEFVEEPVAKIQHLPRLRVWRLFWKRADGRWHGYPPCPETPSLAAALRVIDEDANGCFFG